MYRKPLSLINVAKYLATHVLQLGFLVRHHTLRGRDDRYTKTILHTLELSRAGILPQTRTTDPLQRFDRGFLGGRILFQRDLDHTLFAVILEFVLQDVSLVIKDLRHTLLQIGSRDLHDPMIRHLSIPDSCQKICYWISNHCLSSN